EIWDGVPRLILNAPLFGDGFFTTNRAGNTLVEHIYFFPKAAAHPHNVFLEIWADLGFVGVIFGLLLLYAVWRGLRALSPALLPAAVGATTMILLVLLLSYSMWSAWYIGFLVFFAGFVRLLDQSLREA
ncbi:MAG: O-antigen ligase family protein, partial [Hyphomicrobiales bacterium]